MKKIQYIAYVMILIYIIILVFVDYSCSILDMTELNKVEITINKPSERSNLDFVEDLVGLTKKINTDIMYIHTDISSERIRKEYFISTNTPDFINIYELNVQEILAKYNGISNNSNEKSYYMLKYPTLVYDIYFYPIEKVEKYNLESCKFYVDLDFENRIISSLKDEGYEVIKENHSIVKSHFLSLRRIIMPIILLLTSIVYCAINRKRETVIRLISGYSKVLVAIENSCMFYVLMVPITIVSIGLTSFITMICYNADPSEFIMFSIKKLSIFAFFVFISVFIVNIIATASLKANHMKRMNVNYDLYIVSYIMKFTFSFLLIILFSTVLMEIRNIYYVNKANELIGNEIKDYISLPVSNSSTSINDNNQLVYNLRLDEFYEKTVKKYNAILINTRNYRMMSMENDSCLAELYGQNSITVNENYLNLNIIHDIYGEPINRENIVLDKFNILIPEDSREHEQEIIDKYTYSYGINRDDIRTKYYRENEEIHTFNPYSGREDGGIIFNPIIEIYNNNYLPNQMLNYVAGQYYLLKVNSNDPYNEILPILKECKLDGIILYTTNISNVFDNSVAHIKEQLNSDIFQALLYLVSLILVVLYYCIMYFEIFGTKIVYKKINGYNNIEIHIVHLVLLCIQSISCVLIGNLFTVNKSVILVILILELLVFAFNIRKLEENYILRVMKRGI